MYRRLEGVSRVRALTLGTLRALTFFVVLLAVANLVTELVRTYSRKRDAYVLVDDSRSMSLNDGSSSRSQVVRNLLHSAEMDSLSSEFQVKRIIFGGEVLKSMPVDSLRFDQPSTNIAAAIAEAARSGSSTGFAVLISDGEYNDGGNPSGIARSLSFPVFTIGVGDSSRPKDVFVRQIIPAPSIYAGKKSTVRAVIGSFGYGGKRATVQFMEDGSELESKTVNLPDAADAEISFDYTPENVGTHLISINVSPQSDEFNKENNSATVGVDVLKGKYSILLVSGEPESDAAFIRRNIEENQDFDLRVLVQKTPSEFYEKNVDEILSGNYDAIVLYDFPNSSSGSTLDRVSRLLSSTGDPYAYFAGAHFSRDKVMSLPRLPFLCESFQTGEMQAGIAASSSDAGGVILQPLRSLVASNAPLFPPLYYQKIVAIPATNSATLANAVLGGSRLQLPVFFFQTRTRSAAFLAYGLWRLQLMSPISGLRNDFLQDFLSTTLRTLIEGGRQKLLSVHTDKREYDPSERVGFNALLVDQSGSAVDNASVDLKIRNESTKQDVADFELSPAGEGGYNGDAGGLGEGKYSFVAQARSASALGVILGTDSGTVVVDALKTEFVQTPMNPQVLRQIASVTGGEFLSPSRFMSRGLQLQEEMKEPVTLHDTKRFELLSSLPFLAVAFVLLVAEWTIRKVWGLP